MKTTKSRKSNSRKLIAITQLTLDGVMQSPGGPSDNPTNGFTHGGWAMSFCDDPAVGQAIMKIISGKFELLLGRHTYETFAAYWPYHGDNPIGQAFNRATKHVVTRTLTQFDWENSQAISRDVVAEIRKLKKSKGPTLHLWGSSELLQTLIAADLIDEHQLWIVPVVVGKGKRLFENGVPARSLKLVKTLSAPNGILINTYRPAGPLAKYIAPPEPPSKAELARRKKLAAENPKT